jgi:hypothetical protein
VIPAQRIGGFLGALVRLSLDDCQHRGVPDATTTVAAAIGPETGYGVGTHRLERFGLCPACQGAQ